MKKNNRPKVVVITGGSSGIGKLLLEKYELRGDKVYMLSRTNPGDLENHIPCDVSDETAVKNAFAEIASKEKNIDILINNAGVGIVGAVELLDSAGVRKCIDVNVMGVFYCCKYALPVMDRGSKIVNMSSVIAIFARPFHTIYGTAKAGVSMFTNGLRMELAHTGIQVTAFCPTGLATPFSKNRIAELKTNKRYGNRVKTAHSSVENRKRMSPEKAAAEIFRKINKRKLKPMYIIGGEFKFLCFMQRFLPQRFIQWMTNNLFGGKK
jgi:short-subunit dehydrogenase